MSGHRAGPAGPRRDDHEHHGRLRPPRRPARRRDGDRGPRFERRADRAVQAAGRHFRRSHHGRRRPVFRRRAPRSGRQGGAFRAPAETQGQHHDGGRTPVRRSHAGKLDRRAARTAARDRRGPGPPRPRGRPPDAAEARARSAAPRSGGAGAGREPVDVHALHLRAAGVDAGRLRALQGQADAELRREFAVRSVGRQALAAEDGRGDRRRQRRRQVEREVLVRAAGRRPLVPRGCELRGRRHAGDIPRRPADRSTADRRPGQRSAGRRCPARHRSGQGPAGAGRQNSGRQESGRQNRNQARSEAGRGEPRGAG